MVGVTLTQPPVTGCMAWKKCLLVANMRWRSNKEMKKKNKKYPKPHKKGCFLNHQVSLSVIQNPMKERRSFFPSASVDFGESALF